MPHRFEAFARPDGHPRAAGSIGRLEGGGPSSGTQELPDGTRGVVVPIQYVEVIRTLERLSLSGDVSAARELRNWKNEHPEVSEHVSLEGQPAVQRDRLLRALMPVAEGVVSIDQLLSLVSQLRPEEGQEGIDSVPASTDHPIMQHREDGEAAR